MRYQSFKLAVYATAPGRLALVNILKTAPVFNINIGKVVSNKHSAFRYTKTVTYDDKL